MSLGTARKPNIRPTMDFSINLGLRRFWAQGKMFQQHRNPNPSCAIKQLWYKEKVNNDRNRY